MKKYNNMNFHIYVFIMNIINFKMFEFKSLKLIIFCLNLNFKYSFFDNKKYNNLNDYKI